MTSGTKIEKIISVHPVIEPVTAYLLYVAYDGWIFSGRLVWRVDKISLREGRTGAYLSHCKSNEAETVLRSGIPAEFDLMTGDCNVPPIGLDYFLPPYNTKVRNELINQSINPKKYAFIHFSSPRNRNLLRIRITSLYCNISPMSRYPIL